MQLTQPMAARKQHLHRLKMWRAVDYEMFCVRDVQGGLSANFVLGHVDVHEPPQERVHLSKVSPGLGD